MVFEGDCAGVVGNVEGQDDAEAVDVKDRLTVHIGRPEPKRGTTTLWWYKWRLGSLRCQIHSSPAQRQRYLINLLAVIPVTISAGNSCVELLELAQYILPMCRTT